jgi:hypothetical protein
MISEAEFDKTAAQLTGAPAPAAAPASAQKEGNK